MTKAEQPTITPEDRKAYAALYLKDQGEPHSAHDLSVAAEIEMGLHDDWDGVQAFAAHRKLHESTPENNLAGGLWYRRWFALANHRYASLAAQDACPSCNGLNISCPEGCGRDSVTGELDGSTLKLAAQDGLVEALEVIAVGEGCMNGIREELSADALRKIARKALAAIKGDKS